MAYTNGWCRKGWHHYCPDTPHGGLAGNDGLTEMWQLVVGNCTCSCHRPDGQMSLEEQA